jgi:NAD(P)-dependent dehydrogenase (short-subunit alcohol dehydrogenase family)
LRGRLEEIRASGAELVIVGNGSVSFARAFREDLHLDGVTLLVDPELRAYRAAGLRRGRVEVLSPRLPGQALRALRGGFRQGAVQGDPWQLGGAFVIRPDGSLAFQHHAREAGDHPDVDEILDALRPGAPDVAEGESPGALQRLAGHAAAALLDPTIAGAFGRPGFQARALTFDPRDLDVDLSGRVCLVTGASSGLGFEAALGLADLGARVALLCRDEAKGERARQAIAEQTGNPEVSALRLDVSDLAAIEEAGARLARGRVDVLVHNAGLLPAARSETRQGLELCFATHVAGPHRLTHALRPALERSEDGRVVWVSSGGMYTRRLQLDDWNWQRRPYDGVTAYAETKRAQVVLAELWAEAFAGTSVVVNAMHPGWADTPGVRESIPRFHRVASAILRTPAEGADTIVWLAAAERARRFTGRFFLDREPRRTHYLPTTRESEAERRRFWDLCERVGRGGEHGARAGA